MKLNRHTLRCMNDHMGHWIMHEQRFAVLHDLIMSEKLIFEVDPEAINELPNKSAQDHPTDDEHEEEEDAEFAKIESNGIMVIPINGTMMKGQSSFGGASTVQIRRVLRRAAQNDSVRGAMLLIDSPGGTVAGTNDLAADIRAFGESKPIHAHVSEMMASAAFWAGSQTSHISAGETSETGSLGTVAVVHDMSKAAEDQGIKVHVISTGDFKGAFTPGSEVTKAQLEDLQNIVNNLNEVFMAAVSRGRGFDAKKTAALFDGRVHVAKQALELGLIDQISTFDQAMSHLESVLAPASNNLDNDLITAQNRRRRLT